MPIVSAICPSCGGALEIDNGQPAGICKYCGNAFVTETAVNNYNIRYEVKADTVIMNNRASMEELLEREEVYLKLNEMEKLGSLYEEMVKLYPKRCEGWWGKILLLTNRFRSYSADRKQTDTWFGFVRESAPPEALPSYQKQYNTYLIAKLGSEIGKRQQEISEAGKKHDMEMLKLNATHRSAKRSAAASRIGALFMTVLTVAMVAAWIGSYLMVKANWNKDEADVPKLAWVAFGALFVLPIVLIIALRIFFKAYEFGDGGYYSRQAKEAEQSAREENDCYSTEHQNRLSSIQAMQEEITSLEQETAAL